MKEVVMANKIFLWVASVVLGFFSFSFLFDGYVWSSLGFTGFGLLLGTLSAWCGYAAITRKD